MTLTTTYMQANQKEEKNVQPSWLNADSYPFRSRFVEVDGQNIHYIDEGKGPTLLFLHANPLWSFTYRDLIRELRKDFRCIALDYPGYGLSQKDGEYVHGLETNSHLVENFIETLNLSRITLYAHDASCSIGLGVVTRKPEIFKAVVVSNSFAWPIDPYPSIRRFVSFAASAPFAFFNRNFNFMLRYLTTNLYSKDGTKLSDSEKSAFLSPFRRPQSREPIGQLFRSILESGEYLKNLQKELATMDQLPVLIIFGDDDATFEAGWHKKFEEMFSEHTTVIVEGGHHFPHEYDPEFIVQKFRKWYANLE